MSTVTETIRAEFRTILPKVEAIRHAAEQMDETPLSEMKRVVDETLAFVNGTLASRAAAEAAVVYPVINHLYGDAPVTAVMAHDHREIDLIAKHLASLRKLMDGPVTSPKELKMIRRELTRLMFSLYALTRSHISKEDEVYLPLLEQSLSPAEP